MGAWIEIVPKPLAEDYIWTSHPLWVRGLKLESLFNNLGIRIVAPFMGAWIEIFVKLS